MTIVSAYCVFAGEEEAGRIGRQMVEERLAACVNILGGCRSVYRWQGGVEQGEEVAAIFKTTSAAAEALVARIVALHSYEVPCITVWPVATALADYAKWVDESVEFSRS